MSYLFYVMTIPGLETLAFSEIRASVPDAELVKFARGIALFRVETFSQHLLKLRTVEDLFCVLVHVKGLGNGPDALRVLHSATLNSPIEKTLSFWSRKRGVRPMTWRVVSQKVGQHDFRRKDAGQSVHAALRRVLPRSMRPVNEDADVEFWVWLSGSEALIGLRLSDATLRHRTYKRSHLPASLRPTVAAAMCQLARPTPQDIVLDPLCGVGTILIERGLLAPFDRLIGGDKEEEAVVLARRNARSANVGVSWHIWDACSLPLENASVSRLITNLPFGKQIGTHEANVSLYSGLVGEFGRVLTNDGLLVTLTSEDQLWETLLEQHDWTIEKRVMLVVLGQPASIFVAQRT